MPTVPAQKFAMKARRSWHIVSSGIGAIAAGAGVLQQGRAPAVGWVAIACGAVLAVWFGQPAWRRAPMLWFDDAGLRGRIPGFGPLAWTDIERVRFVRNRGRAFLLVDRTAEERRRRPLGNIARSLARAAETDDLAVPLDALETAPDKVFAVVDLAHRHARGQS